ncbi:MULTISPECIES: hypothetical protein [Capnocytophaga]|jgi:hypothetical protein|uniref:hypothetical protein n=1 Tax=Capnocytophaga TaxID=1016 RepID=UPI0028D7BFD7|nr:hypothetical protein [Capnocytophaga bilenii]
MACKKDHSAIQDIMADLPLDQGGKGRHKCAACAYEKGFEAGKELEEIINLSEIFDSLEESQAKNQRHKSPHSAFAQGYLDGVQAYYDNR